MYYSYHQEYERRVWTIQLEQDLLRKDTGSDIHCHPDLIDFQLQCQAWLSQYEEARQHLDGDHIAFWLGPCTAQQLDALRTCHRIHQEFLMRFVPQARRTPVAPSIELPCPCADTSYWINHTETARWVCTECGRVRGYDYVLESCLDYEDRVTRARTRIHKYRPDQYLQRLLNEIQGIHGTPVPPALLAAVSNNLYAHGIGPADITPAHVRVALKRLRLSSYYPYRWSIAAKLNPLLELPTLSHDTLTKIHAIFQSMRVRFSHTTHALGLSRKSLPNYPSFLRFVLHYLGLHEEANILPPLRSSQKRLDQDTLLHALLQPSLDA